MSWLQTFSTALRWRNEPTLRQVALLASLTAFVPFSIDTYWPSLPQIAVELSSSTAHVQHTISAFLGACAWACCFTARCRTAMDGAHCCWEA